MWVRCAEHWGPGEEIWRRDIRSGSWVGIPHGVLDTVIRICIPLDTFRPPILAAHDTREK